MYKYGVLSSTADHLLPKGNVRSSCEECTRLWREFAAATTEHIRLDSKLRLAALEHNGEKITWLKPRVECAQRLRNELRVAIRKHEEKCMPVEHNTLNPHNGVP